MELPSTLKEVFDDILLPSALKCGIGLFDFWDMTYGEIILQIKTHNELDKLEAKERIAANYNLAAMIANFVNLSFNGKKVPKMEALFPNLYTEEKKDEHNLTKAEYNRAMMIKEQFIDFANRRNRKLAKEGDKVSGD